MTGTTFFFDWEVSLIEWLQSFATPIINAIAIFFTMFGEEMVLVAVIGGIYWCLDKEKGKYIATNFLPTVVAGPMIKNIAVRRRPYMDHKGRIECLKIVDSSGDMYDLAVQGFSFPSMHASNTLSVLGSFALSVKKKTVYYITFVFLLMIGLSRVFVGVHYPTDVLAGWLLGIVMLIFVSLMQKKIKNHLVYAAVFCVLALPGWFYCTSNDFYTAYGLLIGVFVAFWFESRFVKFKNKKNILRALLRLAGGLAIFLGLSEGLKLPFSKSFLAEDGFLPHLIRCIRYAVSSFTVMALYPMLFKVTDTVIGKRKNGREADKR